MMTAPELRHSNEHDSFYTADIAHARFEVGTAHLEIVGRTDNV
jgi:hypothetical protein